KVMLHARLPFGKWRAVFELPATITCERQRAYDEFQSRFRRRNVRGCYAGSILHGIAVIILLNVRKEFSRPRAAAPRRWVIRRAPCLALWLLEKRCQSAWHTLR